MTYESKTGKRILTWDCIWHWVISNLAKKHNLNQHHTDYKDHSTLVHIKKRCKIQQHNLYRSTSLTMSYNKNSNLFKFTPNHLLKI